jgi:hypothetical protein
LILCYRNELKFTYEHLQFQGGEGREVRKGKEREGRGVSPQTQKPNSACGGN